MTSRFTLQRMAHDEETHTEVQEAEQKVTRRTAKKQRRMRVTGKSVFVLGRLLRGGPKTRTSLRRATRRKGRSRSARPS